MLVVAVCCQVQPVRCIWGAAGAARLCRVVPCRGVAAGRAHGHNHVGMPVWDGNWRSCVVDDLSSSVPCFFLGYVRVRLCVCVCVCVCFLLHLCTLGARSREPGCVCVCVFYEGYLRKWRLDKWQRLLPSQASCLLTACWPPCVRVQYTTGQATRSARTKPPANMSRTTGRAKSRQSTKKNVFRRTYLDQMISRAAATDGPTSSVDNSMYWNAAVPRMTPGERFEKHAVRFYSEKQARANYGRDSPGPVRARLHVACRLAGVCC